MKEKPIDESPYSKNSKKRLEKTKIRYIRQQAEAQKSQWLA